MPADPASPASSESTVKSISFVSNGNLVRFSLVSGQKLWYVVLLSCTICFLLFIYNKPEFSVFIGSATGDNRCTGRYIYIHNISSRFNTDLVRWPECRKLGKWYDLCPFMADDGLGPPLDGILGGDTSWYATDQFALELIFHSRMKQYECLTSDSSMASAIYVPFYVGLDVGSHLWDSNNSVRDSPSLELLRWLKVAPEWKVMHGRDHFTVAGRTTSDLRRSSDNINWGSKFLYLPEARNMTVLIIESCPWHDNDMGIPYPTYFHPSRDGEVYAWQDRMRTEQRKWLFCFAGASRAPGTITGMIRDRIISQCSSSTRCSLLHIGREHYTPGHVIKLFQSSVFCLQPPGDTLTRRSIFDSMITGCIPVFFTPGSAYIQYIWHLPRNYTKYSVLIPEDDFKLGKVEIEEYLSKFSEQELRDMREEVIKTIPQLIYRNHKTEDYTMKDAFDVAVEGILQRVGDMRRFVKLGLPLPAFDEDDSWKRALGWTGGEHEWDHYFRHP